MLSSERKQELCKQCQKCCQIIAFPTKYSVYDRFAKELYETRGWKTKVHRGVLWVFGEVICPQLTPDGCKIYNARPAACKMYDGRDDNIMRDDCLWTKETENGD